MANASEALENENPGALAGATGVEGTQEGVSFIVDPYTDGDSHAIHHATADAIRSLCRAGSSHFKAAVAWGALTEMTAEDAAKVAALFAPAGPPIPAIFDPMADASWWAGLATAQERRAYCLATFLALSRRERREFVAFAQGALA